VKQLLAVASFTCAAVAGAAPGVYTTWMPWEADAVVTAWVLKRYVAPNAHFVAQPRGFEPVQGEAGIDMPDSPYRRSGRNTAFDAALRIHNIDTPCTRRLQPMVRLLELAKWRKSSMPAAEAFEAELVPLLPGRPGEEPDAAFAFIDRYCVREGGDS